VEYNLLDEKSEKIVMDDNEKVRVKVLSRELEQIWCLEEIMDRQRARDKQIFEEGRNNAYFHAVTNHRNRKKRIESIRGPNGVVTDTSDILRVAADYYKNMFRWESRGTISLETQFWESSEMVSPEENLESVAPFLEQEIKDAIFGSHAEGAPGPDGLSFQFYQKF
jgi:hypothetical protein